MEKSKLKIKLSTIAALDPTGRCRFLESLQALRGSPHLKAKQLYWLARISQAVEPEVQAYTAASRSMIITLGKKNDAGYVLEGDAMEKYKKEMESIDREVELPIDEKLKLPDEKLGVDLMPLLDIIEIA